MSIPKEDKVKQKKSIIINALRRCLLKDVYSRITVQEIANEAGFSKGGVLHYFSAKEDIYIELLEDILLDVEKAHRDILERDEEEVVAPLSALLGVESFILNKSNIRVIINFFLYAFEEPKIMEIIKDFIEKHKIFYNELIERSRETRPQRRKTDLEPKYISRMAQTIVLFIGILETIDPIDIDYAELVKFLSSMLKS